MVASRCRTEAAVLLGLCLGLLSGSAGIADMVFSGYTQARLNVFDSALDKPDGFDLARVRLKYSGTLNERGTTAALQVELAKLDDRQNDADPRNRQITLCDAWVQHPLSAQWAARMGFAIIPFGFEEEYSRSKALTFDRTKAATTFFPGERDTGVYFFYTPRTSGAPQVALGYSNGMDRWGDQDPKTGDQDAEAHAWTGRLQWSLPRGSVAGLSYMTAQRDRRVGGVRQDLDQNCLGAHLRFNGAQGLNLQAEYYTGEILSVDSHGWYGQVEYTPNPRGLKPFYRYDVFDDGVEGHQTYKRHTLGAALDLAPTERFTLQVERYDDTKGESFTNYGLQYQFMYGGK